MVEKRTKYKGFSQKDLGERKPDDEESHTERKGDDKVVPAGDELFGKDAIESLEINGRLKESLALQGFTKLTKVQQLAFKPIFDDGDVLIKSATGSGKTLAYMLPLAQRILEWTANNRIDRGYGTLGIIMVPTRELAEQCHEVLRKTLQKCSFLVCGCIKGGELRKKEKARLRHGVHLLVATVGRLLDHLRTTSSFDVSKLQYLVFDEADRLLDMGYEKDITNIKAILTERKAPIVKSVLVSATLGGGIKRLSHYVLKNPTIVGQELDEGDEPVEGDGPGEEARHGETEKYVFPSTLTQHYLVAPTKLRLVLLLTFLKWKLSASPVPQLPPSTAVRENVVFINAAPRKRDPSMPEGVKIIVFFSSSDSVEYHYLLISYLRVQSRERKKKAKTDEAVLKERRASAKKRKGAQKKKFAGANAHLDYDDEDGFQEYEDEREEMNDEEHGSEEPEDDEEDEGDVEPFIDTNLFKLHGNMSQVDRTAIYEAFKHCSNGILLATDVASRGLDMPGVQWCIQYDPATDPKSYTHRIGRTARAGKKGDALLFVNPHEEKYVEWMQQELGFSIQPMSAQLVLYHMAEFLGGTHLLETASQLHSRCEKASSHHYDLRRLSAIAYQAYLRAYAAYPKQLIHIFNVHNLHLGHVAKSFAIVKNPSKLRDVVKDQRSGATTRGVYEPSLVRKAKHEERFREGGTGRTRTEEEAAQAKKAFRKPKATSRVGQFSEFASGDDAIDFSALTGGAPAAKKRKKAR